MPSPASILQQYWGYTAFRGKQEAIIGAVLEGKDTLALLPTGGGKSICFQVPALAMEGLCLVISPLIALMRDQVENLNKKGIPALALHSGMTYYEVKQALLHAAHGEYKFLYLSPERLETQVFKEYLPLLDVNLLAIDEAHCISQWGYDFRPPYLRIAALRPELPGVPVIALTASATPLVQQDIIEKLHLKQPGVFRQSFEKPHLSYSVFLTSSKVNKAIEVLKNVPGSAIIYCRSRRQTKDLSQLLQQQNIPADYYHAGLTQQERNAKQTAWINNQTRVMVCTNAFGMGIDKPDVRVVIHYDVPDCLENYYQEAGRAGRDEQKAYAVLLYQQQDLRDLQSLPDLRFPSVEEIKTIYQALADYLQIPVGLGEGNYYDFDIASFITNFQLDTYQVLNVLKVLEQEGHLSFNESVFLPPRVEFTSDKSILEDFEAAHPNLEPLIKALLRSYEGIYENSVSINEKQLAWLLRSKEEEVRAGLLHLQAFGIIEYLPRKETPQVHFILNRAPAQYLRINHEAYLQRKEYYRQRVETMVQYIGLEKDCRSQYISAYFGDKEVAECGICDNCLARKQPATDEAIIKKVQQYIQDSPVATMTTNALLQHFTGYRKEQVWKAILFLQEESVIAVNEQGMIRRS